VHGYVVYLGTSTLRRLVDELPEDRVSVALVEVQRLVGTSDPPSGLPRGSGQCDLVAQTP
jgi:hypothetical protein